MLGPIRDRVDALQPFRRNLALDLIGMFGMGTTAALIASFLPTIARRGGLDPLGLAALAGMPFLAATLSVFSGRLGPRTTRQLALLRAVGAGSLLVIPLAPVPAVIIGATFAFWISNQFSTPFQQRQWGVLYPARMRARVVGFMGSGRMAASVLAGIAGTLLADRLGGPVAVALAGVVGGLCALAYLGIRSAGTMLPPPYSARQSVRAILDRPGLRRLALAQGIYFGGLTAAMPLFALVNVDRLNLSLAEVGVIALLTAAGSGLSFLPWGAVADRLGFLAPMRIGTSVGLCGLVGYALAQDVAVLWVAAFAIGVSNASTEVGVLHAISTQTSIAGRAPAMSGWNAIAGVRGVVAAFAVSPLVQAGIVDLTAGLVLCVVAAAIGVALFWRMDPHPVRPKAVVAA